MCTLACVLFLCLVVVPNITVLVWCLYLHTCVHSTHTCAHMYVRSCVPWPGVECIMCKPFLYLELLLEALSFSYWVRCEVFCMGRGRRHSKALQYVTFVSVVYYMYIYEEELLVVWHCSLKFPPIHAIHKAPPTYICTYMWTYLLLATAHVVVSLC